MRFLSSLTTCAIAIVIALGATSTVAAEASSQGESSEKTMTRDAFTRRYILQFRTTPELKKETPDYRIDGWRLRAVRSQTNTSPFSNVATESFNALPSGSAHLLANPRRSPWAENQKSDTKAK